jgi:hypothetical protein
MARQNAQAIACAVLHLSGVFAILSQLPLCKLQHLQLQLLFAMRCAFVCSVAAWVDELCG